MATKKNASKKVSNVSPIKNKEEKKQIWECETCYTPKKAPQKKDVVPTKDCNKKRTWIVHF
jgi:hypothetical protein